MLRAGLKILCRNPAEMGAAVLHPGTATTLDVIVPGLRTMESLVGRSTIEHPIGSAIQEFAQKSVLCMGTGGFSRLFENAGPFDDIQANLVLQGLYHTLKLKLNRTRRVSNQATEHPEHEKAHCGVSVRLSLGVRTQNTGT